MQYVKGFFVALIASLIWVFICGTCAFKIYEYLEPSLRHDDYQSDIIRPSTSEIEGFNSTFTTYEGIQTGSNVKALLQRLIANSNTFKDEPDKIPHVSYNSQKNGAKYVEQNKNEAYDKVAYGVINKDKTDGYIAFLYVLSKGLDLKHKYNVVITQNERGVVAGITINYDEYDTSSNFIIVSRGVPNSINGLKGVEELVDGEIKTTSDDLDEIKRKNSQNYSSNDENKNNTNTIIVVSTDDIEE